LAPVGPMPSRSFVTSDVAAVSSFRRLVVGFGRYSFPPHFGLLRIDLRWIDNSIETSLMKTFLLRFQENIGPSGVELGTSRLSSSSDFADGEKNILRVVAGTKTITEVRRESVDADPGMEGYFAFPK
jgi:hypothetical protein